MERDEERPDADPEEEGAAKEAAASEEPAQAEAQEKTAKAEGSAEPVSVAAAQGSPSGRPAHIVWALVSAVVLVVFAPGLFVAGFFTNELVNDDGGGTAAVAQPSPAPGTPSALPTVTPPPLVAASADDDPFMGPDDASVTVIEFSDYQ